MSSHSYTEKELLLQVAEGNEDAFNTLYDSYWPKVYNYLYNIIKSPEIAEELVVDIFVKIWTGRHWLQQIDNLGAFLRTTARNKALDYLKITARKNKKIEAYYADMLLQSTQDPEDRLLNAEVQQIWRTAVDQLSPQKKNIFMLHREQGLSYQEIAQQLNISPATVKKTMFLALDAIREFLKTHYKESLGAFLLFLRL